LSSNAPRHCEQKTQTPPSLQRNVGLQSFLLALDNTRPGNALSPPLRCPWPHTFSHYSVFPSPFSSVNYAVLDSSVVCEWRSPFPLFFFAFPLRRTCNNSLELFFVYLPFPSPPKRYLCCPTLPDEATGTGLKTCFCIGSSRSARTRGGMRPFIFYRPIDVNYIAWSSRVPRSGTRTSALPGYYRSAFLVNPSRSTRTAT